MVQTIQPAELAYGFDNVYSNVPLGRLDRLWRHVAAADRDPESGFSLKPNHNTLVVDLNRFHLHGMLERITADVLREFTKGSLSDQFDQIQETGDRYPHHTSDTVLYFFHPKNTGSTPDVEVIYGRVKNRDSLTEKVTRELAQNDRAHSEMLDNAVGGRRSHLAVDDCYGITFVCRDEELLYAVRDRLRDAPYLVPLLTKDFVREGAKDTGYRAVHEKFMFMDGVEGANGILLDVHLETKDDSFKNKFGNGEPERAHKVYSMKKLTSSQHRQGNNQILIFEKNGQDHDLIVPVNIGNRFAQYTLFNY